MATIPTPPPGSSPPGNTVILTIAVDAKTGQLTIQNITAGLKGLGSAAGGAGQAAGGAGQSAGSSANGWLKLFAQTELVVKGFRAVTFAMRETVIESTLIAARTEVLNTTLAVTARNMNYSIGAAQAQVNAVRKMNITHQEAIDLTLAFMRAQLELAKATNLARTAQDLAVVSGENSSQVASSLIDAIQNQNVLMLRQYGIVANAQMIFDKYAATLNRSGDSLSSVERRTAFLNFILVEGTKIQGAYISAMDDAGKKMTSLVRVFQDAKEHVGERFVPVMMKVVDALMAIGETIAHLPGWFIDVVGAMATAATATIILTTAVLGAVKAYQALAEAAVLAGRATTVAGSQGAVAGLLKLVSNAPVLAAILIAVTAIAAVVTTIWARSEATLKTTVTLSREIQGQLTTVKNIQTEQAALTADTEKYLELKKGTWELSERELHTYSSLTEEQNRRVVMQEKSAQLAARQTLLVEQARSLGIELVRIEKDQSTGVERQVIDQEKLAEFQKQTIKAREDALKIADQEVLNRKKAYEASVQEVFQRQKAAAAGRVNLTYWEQLTNTAITHEQAVKQTSQATAKVVEKTMELEKAYKSARDQVAGIRAELTGLQQIKLETSQNLVALAKAVALEELLYQARLRGIKTTALEKSMATSQIEATNTAYKELITQIEAVRQKKVDQAKGDQALIATTNELAKTLTTRATEEKTTTETNLKNFGSLKAAEDASAEGLRRIVPLLRDVSTYGVELPQTWQETATAMLGTSNQLRDVSVSRRLAAQEALVAEKNLAIETLRAGVQTYSVQMEVNKLERERAELQKAAAVHSIQMQGGDAVRFARELDALNARKRAFADEEVLRARRLDLTNLEIQAEKKRQDAYGATLEQRANLTYREYAVEEEAIRRRFTTEKGEIKDVEGLIAALKNHWSGFYDWLSAQTRARNAQLVVLNKEQLEMEQRLTEASVRKPSQRMAVEDTQIGQIRDIAKAQADALEKGGQRRLELIAQGMDKDKAAAQIRLEQQVILAEAEKRIWELQHENISALIEQRNKEKEAIEQIAVSEGRLTQSDADRNKLMRDANVRAAELLQYTELTEGEAEKLVKALQDQARVTGEITRAQRLGGERPGVGMALEGARKAQEYGASTEMVEKQMERLLITLQPVQDQVDRVNEAFNRGEISLTEYAGRIRDLTERHLTTLPELMERIANGTVTPLDVMKAAFGQMGSAALAAFDAIGKGASATGAMRQFAAGMLKEIASMAMVQAAMQTALGIGALFPPFPNAPAAGHFISAAKWFAVAALAGIAGGAASGGGASSGGGAGSSGANVGTPQPVATKTAMEDQIIRLNENLSVNNRVVQYAGHVYDKTGAAWFQLTTDIKMLAASRSQGDREFADRMADSLAKVTQHGFKPLEVQLLFDKMSNYIDQHAQHTIEYSGILDQINTRLLESSQQQNDNLRTLPQMISDRLAENLHGVQRVNDENSQALVVLARKQLEELIKANDKEMTVSVDASTYLDSNSLSGLMDTNYLKNTSTQKRAISGAVVDSAGQNVNRQQLVRTLLNGGV